MKIPQRREFRRSYEGVNTPPYEVWIVDDGDVWTVHCMDCGTRLGTVNAGNEDGTIRLTEDHRKRLHA